MLKDQKSLQIENLIYQLNNVGIERQEALDRLWVLETTTAKLRAQLMALINHKCQEKK